MARMWSFDSTKIKWSHLVSNSIFFTLYRTSFFDLTQSIENQTYQKTYIFKLIVTIIQITYYVEVLLRQHRKKWNFPTRRNTLNKSFSISTFLSNKYYVVSISIIDGLHIWCWIALIYSWPMNSKQDRFGKAVYGTAWRQENQGQAKHL